MISLSPESCVEAMDGLRLISFSDIIDSLGITLVDFGFTFHITPSKFNS